MERSDLTRVIEDEDLIDAVFLDENSLREDAVVLEPRGPEWAVYLTIDRAMIVETTYRTFPTEEEALDHMLWKLRQSAHLRRLMEGLE